MRDPGFYVVFGGDPSGKRGGAYRAGIDNPKWKRSPDVRVLVVWGIGTTQIEALRDASYQLLEAGIAVPADTLPLARIDGKSARKLLNGWCTAEQLGISLPAMLGVMPDEMKP